MNCVKTYILKRYRFVYDSNGRTLDYINWNSGEPNNAGSGEDCVVAEHAKGKWNDLSCSGHPRNFVCQKHFSTSGHDKGNFYSKPGKVLVSKANPIKTFKNYGPEFYVEFKIRINSAPKEIWTNIFHVSNGGNAGAHGNRFPAIWFNKNNYFAFCSTVNDFYNYGYGYCFDYNIELDQDYQIAVSQQYSDQSQLVYKIFLDGKEIHSIVNSNGKTFDVVTLYLSDPWYASINDIGEIWDFTILSGKFLIYI